MDMLFILLTLILFGTAWLLLRLCQSVGGDA